MSRLAGVFQQQDTALVIPNLLAHWKFDEGSGTSVADATGGGRTGTAVGSPTWGTGRFSGCMNFDGTNDYVTVGDHDSLDFGASQNFAVSVWFKTTTAAVSNQWPVIVSKRQTSGTPVNDWNIYLSALGEGDVIYSSVRVSGTEYSVSNSQSYRDGNWHHFVLVRDGTTLRTYYDGSAGNTLTHASISGSLANSHEIRFGAFNISGYEYRFTGSIDDTRLYTRAITQTEVTALYQGNAA